jgi:hypothetical protein
MIISDLSYLEVVSEASSIEGGILNFFTRTRQTSNVWQVSNARAGNIGRNGLSVGNTALALNLAIPTQVSA